MIKIKTAFTLLFGFVVVFLIVIFIALLALFQNRKAFGESQLGQFKTIEISDKLRERNDDLTHYCLNYIITGDTIWVNTYWEQAASSLYRFPNKRKGFELLKDSIKKMGYGASEYEFLKQAIVISNELNKQEASAIEVMQNNAVNGQISKKYRDEALRIISDEAYLINKRRLIKTIVEFEERIQTHTELKRQKNINEGLFLYRGVIVLVAVVIIISLIAFYLIFKKVNKQAQQDALFRQGVKALERTQKQLIESDERFTLAVKSSGARVWEFDIKSKTMLWSPPDINLLDFEPTEIKPELDFVLNQMHRGDRERFKRELNLHIDEAEQFNIDARFYTKSGVLRWCRCIGNSNRDVDGKPSRIVGLFIDITNRVEAEERATNAILETEDKERSRIARDIHDSLQQTMSTALLNFEKVRSSMTIEDDALAEKYQVGYSFLKKAINESRTLAHNLMPKVVDKSGVAVAIESLVTALKGSTDTNLEFYHNLGNDRVKLAAEMTIFRIVQEAINNVIKYAQAKECTIQLLKHNDLLTLTIEDDGVGFVPGQLNDTFGLNSMRKRADAIGAFIQIDSSPGRGTQILLELTI